jgi:hypothetical protein
LLVFTILAAWITSGHAVAAGLVLGTTSRLARRELPSSATLIPRLDATAPDRS